MVADKLKLKEDEIREIMEMYFEYICTEHAPQKKINEIEIGAILSKKVIQSEEKIELTVSNLHFQ